MNTVEDIIESLPVEARNTVALAGYKIVLGTSMPEMLRQAAPLNEITAALPRFEKLGQFLPDAICAFDEHDGPHLAKLIFIAERVELIPARYRAVPPEQLTEDISRIFACVCRECMFKKEPIADNQALAAHFLDIAAIMTDAKKSKAMFNDDPDAYFSIKQTKHKETILACATEVLLDIWGHPCSLNMAHIAEYFPHTAQLVRQRLEPAWQQGVDEYARYAAEDSPSRGTIRLPALLWPYAQPRS